MNKLEVTSNGGIPIVLDDIRFEEDSIREAFEGIVDSFGAGADEGYILNGCEQTIAPPNINIKAGFVVLEGEVYKVPSHSVPQTPGGGNSLFWKVQEANDPAGLKALEAGGTVDTYKLRTAKVVDEPTPGGLFTPITAPTIAEKIADLVKPELGTWTRISLAGDPNVVQNDNNLGTGTDTAPAVAPTGGFFKYNIIGNTVNIIWDFNVVTTTYSVAPAATIKLKALPFTFSADEEAGAASMFNVLIGGLSGQGQVLHTPSTNELVFRMPTIGGGIGALNRLYTMDTAPTKNVAPTGDLSTQHTWNLSGSATFEIV